MMGSGKSRLTTWFMNTKQAVTCEENMNRRQNIILDMRNHSLEECEDFTKHLSLGHIQKLKGLLLQRNDLKEFTNSLPHYLEELKYLTLDYNLLTDLPFDVRNMRNLTVLNVSHNQFIGLHFFHVICQLKLLKILWANATGLQEIPKEIKELKKLRTLGLRRNQITSLPEELFTLSNLRWLTLTWNQISVLPDRVEKLKHLVHLNLSHNQLTELPTSLIYLRELHYLFIMHNFIRVTEEVVDFIKTIPNLKSCSFKGNLRSPEMRKNQAEVIQIPVRDQRRRAYGVQSPISSEVENVWYSAEESGTHVTNESDSLSNSHNNMKGRENFGNSSTSAAVETLVDELETIYRYNPNNLNGSIGMSISTTEFQGRDDAGSYSINLDRNDLDPGKRASSYHLSLDKARQRIQEWLLKHNDNTASGSGNIISSSSSASFPPQNGDSDPPVTDEAQDNNNNNLECHNFPQDHVKEQVDCFIEDAVEMVTDSLEQLPVARTTSMYILPHVRSSSQDRLSPSASVTFHCRRCVSSVVKTPSASLHVESQINNNSSNGILSRQEEMEEYEEVLEERDDRNTHMNREFPEALSTPGPPSLNTATVEVGRIMTPTVSEMFPESPFEIDTTYDPTSDWEHSSPSSDIDDQDIIARFYEFEDMDSYDNSESNYHALDEDDLRYLIPIAYMT